MTLDFRCKGSIVLTQYDTIKKFWQILPNALKGVCRSVPVPKNLFKVDSNSPRVKDKLTEDYHTRTAK